ncbi:HAMP domain-containing methyl-accepting chemotaxis protein [Thermopirellula anaerolimosa]
MAHSLFSRLTIKSKLIGGFCLVASASALVGGIGYWALTGFQRCSDTVSQTILPSIDSLKGVKSAFEELRIAQRTLLTQKLSDADWQRQFEDIAAARKTYQAECEKFEAVIQTDDMRRLWEEFKSAVAEWRDLNNAGLDQCREIRSLDVGDPADFLYQIENLRGKHYELLAKTQALLLTGTAFEGGEDYASCAFGKWIAQLRTQNPTIRRIVSEQAEVDRRFHAAVAEIKRLKAAGQDHAALQTFKDACDAMNDVLARFEELAALGHSARESENAYVRLVMEDAEEKQMKADSLLNQLITAEEKIADRTVAEGMQNARSAKTLIVGTSVVAFALALVAGISLALSVIRPVRGVVAMLKDVAEGEGDLTKRLSVSSHDELGEMGRWFNTFCDKLELIIADVASTTEQFREGAKIVSDASQSLASGSQEQSASVEQINASMQQMAASVADVKRVAVAARALGTETEETAKRGEKAVNQSLEAMDDIRKNARQISQIIQVISEIAGQTNLLALNAAIEAARAGQHGMGFAVVADEVRKLAERANRAAAEISQLIRRANESVEQGAELSQAVAKALHDIVAAVDNTSGKIGEIAEAAAVQAESAEEIARAVAGITDIVNHTASSSEELASSSEELGSQADALSRIVGRFKIRPVLHGAGA